MTRTIAVLGFVLAATNVQAQVNPPYPPPAGWDTVRSWPPVVCTPTRTPFQPTTRQYQFGQPGDVPIIGVDFDFDCLPDLVVFRPSNGTWYIRTSGSGLKDVISYQWGLPGDVPAAADYDHDGHTDLAIFRPSTGEWFIRYWSAQGF